ncbi:uncharacterized protein (TIGR02271 family) [Planomicrobium soli]|uniref:Uncharacterized protein (TIGR02271 family) n=1 Tax=Planomicrobium soli TaxID=1176648 RepID=A0A2P8GK12_9BACL|nr:DUF2382 domain-containing protein [Planomicrobium soli]PSL34304.1 uncharacterized protein (TIGR02271 family) [Planomicrobium soli]
MADNKFMGTFDTEQEVLRKIEELKAQGATEDHMYVMARDEDQLSMVRGRTDVDYKAAEVGWKDKFMGFLSGNEPVRQAFAGMGVDEHEADRYYHEVQNGKILLFVDRDYDSTTQSTETPQNAAYGTPSPDRTNYVDTGTVARDGLTVDTNDQNDVYFNEDRRDLYADGSKSPSSSADTSYEETAGVGDKTGTGFGLGTGDTVNDTPNPNRNTNDFSATNSDRDSSATPDSSSGMFGSGGQGAEERTTTNQSSNLFGSDDSNQNNESKSGGVLGGLFGGNSDRNDDSTSGVRTDSGTYDTSRGRADDNQGLGTGADTNRNAGAFTSGSPGTRGGSDIDRVAGTEEETLRLHEERLQVDKDRVQTGEVNIGKHVVEERRTIDVPVEREEIVIERRPVNKEVSDTNQTGGSGVSAQAYQEGDSIHIPLTEERVEVNKTNVVSEEIVVGKRKVQDTETINETVRREEADIDDDTNTGLNRDNKDRF